VRDSAGVAIVRNPAIGLWTEAQRWTVREDLRIGAGEGRPEYQLGAIGWLDVGSDGRIYVLDTQGQHVKVFSAGGRYERTIGGPGAEAGRDRAWRDLRLRHLRRHPVRPGPRQPPPEPVYRGRDASGVRPAPP